MAMTIDRSIGSTVRVLIVEDHDLVREQLITRLDAQPDISVVGGVGTVAAAIEQVSALLPDVAVLDVQLPDGNGLALCRRIRAISAATRCIFHTAVQIGPESAASVGAVAVVVKQLAGDELLSAIRRAAQDDVNDVVDNGPM
jgi:two-component system, NarL family, response regulator DevR